MDEDRTTRARSTTGSTDQHVEDHGGSAQADQVGSEDFHLGKATEEELKRLVAHPIQERRRLRAEVEEGQTVGLAFLLSRIAFMVWLLAALLMTVVFVVAYLAA